MHCNYLATISELHLDGMHPGIHIVSLSLTTLVFTKLECRLIGSLYTSIYINKSALVQWSGLALHSRYCWFDLVNTIHDTSLCYSQQYLQQLDQCSSALVTLFFYKSSLKFTEAHRRELQVVSLPSFSGWIKAGENTGTSLFYCLFSSWINYKLFLSWLTLIDLN